MQSPSGKEEDITTTTIINSEIYYRCAKPHNKLVKQIKSREEKGLYE